MARSKQTETTHHESHPKRTTIGSGRLKTSSLNKHKRRSHKPYNGQGR